MKLFNKILEEETDIKRKGTYMYGIYKNFNIVATITDLTQSVSTLIIRICAKSNSEDSKNKINEYLNSLDKKHLGISHTNVDDFFTDIHISNGFQGKMIKQANEFLPNFLDFLNREKFKNVCNLCEDNSNLSTYKLDNSYTVLCSTCASKAEHKCEEANDTIANQKSNIIPGIIGAILGSLLGVIVWVIIYSLGYIASIAGLITVVFAMKGYTKFGKYLDKKGVFISLIISVLMIYVANQTSWAIQVVAMFGEAGVQVPFMTTFLKLFDILKELENLSGETNILSAFYGDLVIGYALSLLVIIPYVLGALKSAKPNLKITKLD